MLSVGPCVVDGNRRRTEQSQVGEFPVLSLNNGQLRTYFLQYNKAITHREGLVYTVDMQLFEIQSVQMV